jgi:redox-sensitive bicupin YhaK (pirin superfamily)
VPRNTGADPEETTVASRSLQSIVDSVPASDGAGVRLRRSLGRLQGLRHDPFLMLDEFFSDNPDDYLAGFPAHPHRGFETVTYMLDGHMRHEDSEGNRGDLGPGDVQWMTAARGIIHSEMPQQTEGRMRGFQLWLNLPAAEKMRPADYRDIPAAEIPVVELPGGGRVKVIAGAFGATRGPIGGRTTQPLFLDIRLPPRAAADVPVPTGHNAFLYAYDGEASVGDDRQLLPHRAAGLLSDGDSVTITAGPDGGNVLLLAGRPLGEPVVQYGPFVMNTREEIERAVLDYQRGELVAPRQA